MKILHVSFTDLTGARFTGYGMRKVLQGEHTVEMAVWDKTLNEPGIHSLRPTWYFRIPTATARRYNDQLLGGWTLPLRDYFRDADIVHLHLIQNAAFFHIMALPMLSRLKPLVWTIHDSWATTGGCLHSFDCDKWLAGCLPPCPYPRRQTLFSRQTPALNWQIKRQAYRMSDMDLVVSSRWMEERVRRSPLLSRFPLHRIPFGVDVELFRPLSKEASREKLGIAPNDNVIAFRDVGLKEPFKGMRWVMEALERLAPSKPTTLLILEGGEEFQTLRGKYSIVTPGWIDGERLVEALSAADLFLMPSLQESFGLMAVESMACATPAVVFEGSALPDVVHVPEAGIAVPAKDSGALALAIDDLLVDVEKRIEMGSRGRVLVEKEYTLQRYARRHVRLYEEAIDRFRKGKV